MKFIQSFFYIIALSFVGIAFGLLSPLLFVLSVLSPSVKKRVVSFADRFEDSEEVSPILFTICSIIDNDLPIGETNTKVMIICENASMLNSIAAEHGKVESEYQFSLMTLADYNANIESRDMAYLYYYFGSDISIQPPVGVLESFYFHVGKK